MKELGTDDIGRKMALTEDGKLKIIAPAGVSATLSRKHIVRIISEHQAEVDKWKKYLDVLDTALAASPSSNSAPRQAD